ncbi:NAD/NADP-dependent octopine/nopaline dehydrogenase family protein [Abyssicoccus albus]|uniref:NAD/NADP-dependent octopine/nopaline dehydrogenase family protein n=1 Tax=Abyssicoccus albus TaxID=1817405 RepID=UPI00097E1C90|nr:NAD/NADP-dependent octopine/nopaline dehydrogenase family protein [Abyssicoccus albus]AQL56803.1 hypothetical protein BVH56_07700 [Abyssicoccus albus]
MNITILGAGNGGIVASVDLTRRGHDVTLYHTPESNADWDRNQLNDGIKFKGETVKINKFTQNIEEAIEHAEVIMVTLPTLAIAHYAKEVAPYLKDGQYIYINGASAMNSMKFMNVVKSEGYNPNVYIGETMSLTYACRYDHTTNEAELILTSTHNLFASYPSKHTSHMIEVLKPMYDTLVPAQNILETTLNNGNPESHPGPAILNTGRIDYAGDEFYLYSQGITKHTVRIVEAIDKERQQICAVLNFEQLDKSARSERSSYFPKGKTLLEQFNTSPILKDLKGPTTLQNRYIVEDVEEGLVLWASIGDAVGVDTPVIDSIIHLTGVLLDRNFFEEGLTLSKLGFDGAISPNTLNNLI